MRNATKTEREWETCVGFTDFCPSRVAKFVKGDFYCAKCAREMRADAPDTALDVAETVSTYSSAFKGYDPHKSLQAAYDRLETLPTDGMDRATIRAIGACMADITIARINIPARSK